MADSNNRTIARNTVFLYSRLIIIMFVTLYTSRVTLKVLGVDDYGIYQSVAGVVSFLAFLKAFKELTETFFPAAILANCWDEM